MSEPERLLDRPPNDLARTLLRAGREEAPSRRSLQRTLSAVGVGAAALGAAGSAGALGAAKVATQATLITLAKWAGVGAFGGIVVAATAHGLAPRQEVTAPPPASIAHVPAAPPTPAAPQVEAPRAEPVVPVVTAEPVQHRPAPPEPVLAEAEAPLAAEVAFVDRGRAAFQRGELAAALAALASYERDFPEPRLLPEVLYLRMEASSHG
ncbi:MAG TPA: hypothetical protein VGK73_22475, partial [Polyangiaceae bacterium]